MRKLACATLVLLATACASAPAPGPLSGGYFSLSTPGVLQLARAPGEAKLEGIGKEELEQARELLFRARDELEPRQWEALDRELAEAERAWADFSRATRTSGQSAQVARGAEGLTRAERARRTVGRLSRVGPLLVALGLLWPSSTAGPEEDSRPAWAEARRKFEARLRAVSEASHQLLEELEAQSNPGEAVAAEPGAAPEPAPGEGSPPAHTLRDRPECQPVPVPHRGGDDTHNRCADVIPPNRFPGHDVLVNGKRFDALQVGVRVLWEIKTDDFDTYSPFLQDRVIRKQVPELRRERDIAQACGYDFVVGVSSATHAAALRDREPELNIVITGCH